MTIIEIKTQAQLDKAISADATDVRFVKKGEFNITCKNWLRVHVEAALQYEVKLVAGGSSHVEAWESSHVEAWESSHVEAWGSSHVVARESSHVVASGYVSISIFGKNIVKMTAKCHAFIHNAAAEITGGKTTKAILKTPADWCEYYGVPVIKGVATVYKSVKGDYSNPYNGTVKYIPGTMPEAKDWDGGKAECGGGLHFSPCISMALEFHKGDDAKYLACQIKLSEMAVHFDGSYPNKCKAKRVIAPLIEVDRNGNPIVKKDAA